MKEKKKFLWMREMTLHTIEGKKSKTVLFVLASLLLLSCESENPYHNHPRLAQSSWPIVHRNPAQQAGSEFPGPKPPLEVKTFDHRGPGWVLFDSKGNPVFGNANPLQGKHEFKKFDRNMNLLASLSLSFENTTSILGGIYSFIDHQDCIWTSLDMTIYRLCQKGRTFEEKMKFDISKISNAFSSQETILALMPLYKPEAWMEIAFATMGIEYIREGNLLKVNIPGAKLGILQIFDKDNASVYYYQFKEEAIQNASALDKNDNIYLITNKKLYKMKFNHSSKTIEKLWEYPYDPGPPPEEIECEEGSQIYVCLFLHYLKKVRFFNGSGTTPTLMGDNEEYVGFADGALPMKVIILRTQDGSPVEVDEPIPFSYDQNSQTENSMAYINHKFIIDNNNPEGTGVACYEIKGNYGNEKVELLWVNKDVFAPNNVPLVSGPSNEGYVYELIKEGEKEKWFLTSLDLNNGNVKWREFIEEGFEYNSMYAPLDLNDKGEIYIGLFGKILRVRNGVGE